ncbi:MAG: YicC family protein [Betaproteobacteria bacterium]|nr:YicC family protein [Betaproteobacteria bacterium]NBY05557.1 YicC family protein [Betaproteobacteria bacterium]
MTGYASTQVLLPSPAPSATPALRLGLEIRSVNSRFLDLGFRMPDELRPHEAALRDLISAQIKRGKVEVRIHLESPDAAGLVAPSPDLLQHLAQLQKLVQAELPQARGLSVADVIKLSVQPPSEALALGPALMKITQESIASLLQSRAREGQRLSQHLLAQVTQLQALVAKAIPLVPSLVAQQRQRFLDRWQEAMSLGQEAVSPELAQERALSEATAFAIRIDVAEELTRLSAHLDEITQSLQNPPAREGVGKRLDFLIQELHREANTLGSKSAALEMTRVGMDMKVLIEQMREQVQNLE